MVLDLGMKWFLRKIKRGERELLGCFFPFHELWHSPLLEKPGNAKKIVFFDHIPNTKPNLRGNWNCRCVRKT